MKLKHLILLSFLALGIQTQAQTVIPVQNAPFCTGYVDGSKIVLSAAEISNVTYFSWTSPFAAGTLAQSSSIGLEFLGTKPTTCPYRFNDITASDNMTTAAYDPSAWDVPVWYHNATTPSVSTIAIPWNAYPTTFTDAWYTYAAAGGAIVTDAQSHHYYLDLFTIVGSTMYKCKVVFDYTAPFVEHADCGPTAVVAPPPAAPVITGKTSNKPPKK